MLISIRNAEGDVISFVDKEQEAKDFVKLHPDHKYKIVEKVWP